MHLAVVIPAHDEESQIAGTLRSIQASDYPAANSRIVVVADNRNDHTAGVARAPAPRCGSDPIRSCAARDMRSTGRSRGFGDP